MEGRSPRGLRQADDTSGSQSYDPTISSYDWILLATFFATPFFSSPLDAPFLSTSLPPFSFFSRGEHLFTIHSTSNLPAMTFPSLVLSSLDPKIPGYHPRFHSPSLSLLHKSKPYLHDNLCSFFVILYTRERRWRTYSLSSG